MAALMIFFILMSRTINGDLIVFERSISAGPEFNRIRIYKEYEYYYFTVSDNYDWIEKSQAGCSNPFKGTVRKRGLVFRGDLDLLTAILEYINFNSLPEHIRSTLSTTPTPYSRYTLIMPDKVEHVLEFTLTGRKNTDLIYKKVVVKDMESLMKNEVRWSDELLNLKLLELYMSSLAEN